MIAAPVLALWGLVVIGLSAVIAHRLSW